jgi:hypothetical protein
MDEEMKAFLAALGESLRSDMAASLAKLDTKCDALADAVSKMKKADDNGDDDTMARQTAADSMGRGELAVLARTIADLQRKVSVPVNRDDLANEQARCDAVLVAHGSRAEAPMHGETNRAYSLRMHRPMQAHSKKWKGVDLQSLAHDDKVIENVLAEIRADALQAGLNPVGLPMFQHREIKTTGPGGHRISTFVGTGTIFKQMARPVRNVKSIGADPRFPQSHGGAVYAAQ